VALRALKMRTVSAHDEKQTTSRRDLAECPMIDLPLLVDRVILVGVKRS
jgi:hypothetical protein